MEERPAERGPTRVTGPVRSAARLLFIDDEASILRTYERAFSGLHEVSLAQGGREAIEALDRQRFDAIVCDLLMPEVNGIQVFEHVRRTRPELCSAFIFVTGSIGQRDVQAFLASVDNRTLEKPFDLAVLREIIATRTPIPAGGRG